MMDMSPREIRQANFWLQRWKLLGGMVKPQLTLAGLTIELHRRIDPSPAIERVQSRTAETLEQELRDNPKKHAHVAELVRLHLHAQAAAAQDELATINSFLSLVRDEETAAAAKAGPDGPPNAA